MSEQDKRFCNGQELKAIYFPDGESVTVEMTATRIEIVMENGQAAGVPWAYVIYKNGDIRKYNLALVEGVLLLKQEGQP